MQHDVLGDDISPAPESSIETRGLLLGRSLKTITSFFYSYIPSTYPSLPSFTFPFNPREVRLVYMLFYVNMLGGIFAKLVSF